MENSVQLWKVCNLKYNIIKKVGNQFGLLLVLIERTAEYVI